MRQPSPRTTDRKAPTNGGDSTATETDPLLQSSAQSFLPSGRRNVTETHAGSVRARRSSRSPTVSVNHHFGSGDIQQQNQMNRALAVDPPERELAHGYDINEDNSHADSSRNSSSSNRSFLMRRQDRQQKQARATMFGNSAPPDHPPLLEIPEEVYGVRKAALQVLKPLTKTWVSGYKAVKFIPTVTSRDIAYLFSLLFTPIFPFSWLFPLASPSQSSLEWQDGLDYYRTSPTGSFFYLLGYRM